MSSNTTDEPIVATEPEQPAPPSELAPWVPDITGSSHDQLVAEQEEQVYLKASIPVIQDVLDWYDECIDHFNRPDIIDGVNPSTPAETVKEAVIYAKQQVAGYREKKREFIMRFSQYIDTEGGKNKS